MALCRGQTYIKRSGYIWLVRRELKPEWKSSNTCVFVYMTGEIIKIDLGSKIHVKEIENYNQYLWKKFQIIPRIIVGEQREHIVNVFACQFQELKENLGLNEKKLVQTILQNPEKYRNMYMERKRK